jgi:hypothetical protein
VHLQNLETLVTLTKSNLKHFHGYSLFLLDRSWSAALDVMRGFAELSSFSCQYPRGAEFGDSRTFISGVPSGAMVDYVMGKSEKNPLPDFFATLAGTTT